MLEIELIKGIILWKCKWNDRRKKIPWIIHKTNVISIIRFYFCFKIHGLCLFLFLLPWNSSFRMCEKPLTSNSCLSCNRNAKKKWRFPLAWWGATHSRNPDCTFSICACDYSILDHLTQCELIERTIKRFVTHFKWYWCVYNIHTLYTHYSFNSNEEF